LWSDAPDPKLLASRDRITGRRFFPAVPASSPLAHRYESIPVAAVGAVYSFTVIHPGPRSGESPFALGLVDFPGPVRVFGRFRGHERPAIGARCVARPDDRFGYVLDTANA
jgi:uncharacterized OB-fold protein